MADPKSIKPAKSARRVAGEGPAARPILLSSGNPSIPNDAVDQALLADWVRQASVLPGEKM